MPPQAVSPWAGVREARFFGKASVQPTIELFMPWSVPNDFSEDCLYLNVWTPSPDHGRRPVMVWIHGGAFQFGSGEEMMPIEQSLVSRGDIVLVTLNYRLGPFGFLNLNELTHGAIPSSGNEGLLDQVAALQWIQDNIEAFGGDPENVTIFGESAGGMSVGALLALPAASGLFHKAIPQSGACHSANSPERIQKIGERVVECVGSSDADVFRGLSSDQILQFQADICSEAEGGEAAWEPNLEIGNQPFQPCVDGTVLPELPIDRVMRGGGAGVPILVGHTLDETKAFVYAEPSLESLDDDGIRAKLGHVPGLDHLMRVYRDEAVKRGDTLGPRELFAAIGSDKQFRIPAIRLAEAQFSHEKRVYSYIYTWPSPMFDGTVGAPHTIELGPIFGICETDDAHRAYFGTGPKLGQLTQRTQLCWTSFARNGDPSCEGVGDWPTYDSERRATMMLGAECLVEDAPYDEERKAWEEVPGEFVGES